MAKIKQSETIVIKRSQIHFAAYNPRKKNPQVVEDLKRNFRRYGFMGGIVWNSSTGNLVGGHKRTEAMDLIHGYAGTPETDYEIKVERVELTDKQEKEQNIFLNNKRVQGETDWFLMADLISEINIDAAGLNDIDIKYIETMVPNFDMGDNKALKEAMADITPLLDKEAQKQHIKEQKELSKKDATSIQGQTHFTVTFKTYNEKAEYLASLGIPEDTIFITSDNFIEALSE